MTIDRFVQRTTKKGSTPAVASPSLRAALVVAPIGSTLQPPFKKRRVDREEIFDGDEEGESAREEKGRSNGGDSAEKKKMKMVWLMDGDGDGGQDHLYDRSTAFESSFAPVKTDKNAIEEYEAMRASEVLEVAAEEGGGGDGAASRLDKRNRILGRSSIYVDAFNLALDTVLEDESHLFDEREKGVFEAWRGLSYEAQYLYVRLFLRKAATWHRIERLGYYSDVANVDAAISCLLEKRELPGSKRRENNELDAQWSLPHEFTFVDDSESGITTMDEAAALLGLEELKALAKEAKVQGKNKADLAKALCRMSKQQAGLLSMGLRPSNTSGSLGNKPPARAATPDGGKGPDANRNMHFLHKILAITGPLVRLSEAVFRLFERVHVVFYRSTEWTEKSLTTMILARISRRNFPEYIVCRSANIFASRGALLEYEHSMRRAFEVDQVLESNGPPGETGFNKVLATFESIAARWREELRGEQAKEVEEGVKEFGESVYLGRFSAGHAYTRIAHKAAHVLGRLHHYKQEHGLLTELLGQRLFHPARRGGWYMRKALLEEHYLWDVAELNTQTSSNPARRRQHWCRVAAATCSTALEDRDTYLIYHHDLQKRLVKLEKRLRIPHRQQHDFGHVRLRQPEEHTVRGIRLVSVDALTTAGTKTVWLDELSLQDPTARVSVESMCLSHYRSQGWKGYHAEGGILRTLFAYLLYDVLFAYVPNVFQTPYQTCPLDLFTDAFYPARQSLINRRLVEIANGRAPAILHKMHHLHFDRRTCVIGLNWNYDPSDLLELVSCFEGEALAAVCRVMAQEYRSRGTGGVPDLILWKKHATPADLEGQERKGKFGDVMFAEVKSANDRLSDTQRLWIHVLAGAGVRVALCSAVARETRAL